MNTDNNKIIAEFLGYEITTDGIQTLYYDKDRDLKALPKYHLDWNWLMEVVEKIESHGFTFEIKKNWSCITLKGEKIILRWEEDKNKIEAVYNACLEFIKWYNQQEK